MTQATRLFHFSDDPAIEVFEPRPVAVPSERPPGQEWLNGPLVWAVSEERRAAYLFPRDCPRILLWLTPATTPEDRERWWGTRTASMLANIEWGWLDRMRDAKLYRYEFAIEPFTPVGDDAWTWVARAAVTPLEMTPCGDLLRALAEHDVELRIMDSLTALSDVWSTSLHASGIRLRGARNWPR